VGECLILPAESFTKRTMKGSHMWASKRPTFQQREEHRLCREAGKGRKQGSLWQELRVTFSWQNELV
jgi:hypothetical protein